MEDVSNEVSGVLEQIAGSRVLLVGLVLGFAPRSLGFALGCLGSPRRNLDIELARPLMLLIKTNVKTNGKSNLFRLALLREIESQIYSDLAIERLNKFPSAI